VTETGEGAGRVGTVLRRHDATAALARGCSIAAAPAAAQTGEVGHLFVVGKMWEMGGTELCDGRKQKSSLKKKYCANKRFPSHQTCDACMEY
jgi:hypothetical protein